MIDVDKQLDYFSWLDFEEKKSHLLKMLEKIKDKHDVFLESYNTLNSVQSVEESRMVDIYKLIFDVSNWLENNKNAKKNELQNEMWEHIRKLHEEEERIRAQENQEVDQLLNNI